MHSEGNCCIVTLVVALFEDGGMKMRKLIFLAAPLALAACAQEAEVEEPVETAEAEAPAVTTANGTATPMTGEVS